MTEEVKAMIRDMYNQGMNPEDISEELGYDECEVMNYCTEILDDFPDDLQYFPDEQDIWVRGNIEAIRTTNACIEMYNWSIDKACE